MATSGLSAQPGFGTAKLPGRQFRHQELELWTRRARGYGAPRGCVPARHASIFLLMAKSVCMLALHCSKYVTAVLPNGHPIQNSAVGANFRSQASDLHLLQQVQRLLRLLAFPAREDSRVVSDCSGRAAAT